MASTIRRVIAGVGAVGLLAVGVQLFGTTSASAHDNVVAGTATCQADGTYTVDWTVTNDYNLADTVTVNSFGPGGSLNTPVPLPLAAAGQPGDSGGMTQTGVAGSATGADLDVKGYWKDDNYTVDSSKGHVDLPGTCLPGKAPAAPEFADGGCANFVVTSPTVTIHADAGVSYSLDGTPRPAGSYPVSAGLHYVDATSTQFALNPNHWSQTLIEHAGACTTTVTPVLPAVSETSCVNHQPTAPTITVPTTPGITYKVDQGPYQPGQSIKVTATTQPGSVFGALDKAWTLTPGSTTEATAQVTLLPAQDCNAKVVPVTPSVTASTCVDHAPTALTLTVPTTPGISYTPKTGTFAPGTTSVVVTATTQPGYEFGALAGTWHQTGPTTATTTVPFPAAVDCGTVATPVTPDVTQASCTATSTTPTAPTLELVRTTGLTYSVSKNGPYSTGEKIVVTATAGKGYYLGGVTTGWKLTSDTVATRTVTFAAGPNACTVGVSATKASFTAQQCVSGRPTTATYTVPNTSGVVYQVNGRSTAAGTYAVKAGTTVTVVAVPQAHYVVRGQSVWQRAFGTTPQCSGQDNQNVHRPSSDTDHSSNTGPLAVTGVPTGSLLGIAIALLVIGGLFTVVATRRRTEDS